MAPAISSTDPTYPLEGGCACRTIRYRLDTPPLVVHCCYCTYCQRESGSAFAVNAMIEATRTTLLSTTEPILFSVPTNSGGGQKIARCPKCYVAVWANYAGGPAVRLVKVGTLDRKDVLTPDVYIFTSTKVPWMVLPDGAKVFEEYYDWEDVWSVDSKARREEFWPLVTEYKKKQKEKVTEGKPEEKYANAINNGLYEVLM